MPDSEFDVVKNFSFIVNDIKTQTYKKEDQLYVDKVILQTENHQVPKQKVTINPTVKDTEVGKKKRNGTVYLHETEEKRDPTIVELDSEFPEIKQLFDAVNDYGKVKLKGMVRTVRDDPEDDWNFFIRPSELDNFKASIPEPEEKADKLSQDSNDSTAEEFVENQTNIESEESKDSNANNRVIFGGGS